MTKEELINKIHLGTWESIMPEIPDNFVDIVITSPPYNVSLGIGNKHKKDKYDTYDDNMPYEDYLDWMTKLFIECNRVLKNGGRICINIGDGANGSVPTHADFTYRMLHLFGNDEDEGFADLRNYGQKEVDAMADFKMMTTVVWDKKQIGASTAWGSYQSPSCPSFPTQFEFIIVMAKGTTKHEGDKDKITVSGKEFQRNSRALWSFPPETRMMELYGHPACFPEELPKRLLQQLTYEDDIVLDPFSGAGTTCTVAKKLKRKYIGIEMSQKYYDKSLIRLGKTPEMADVKTPSWMS
jgi:DNA modification methylase